MPLSVSTPAGEPVYLEAHKALNGLRVGSLAWVHFFSKVVKQAGLKSSLTEPCLLLWFSRQSACCFDLLC